MRRAPIPLIAAALLIGAGIAWFAFGATWFAATGAEPAFSGYVEADYVMVTSALGGTVTAIDVVRGDTVASGARLFALDDEAERAAHDEADAKLRQAQSQLADLLTGRRAPEIDAILAQRAQAEAGLQQAEEEFRRQDKLRGNGVSSGKQLDDARAQRDRARAQLAELDAQLRVARLPGRDDQIRAAQSAIDAAKASLAQADWRLAQKSGSAPAAGLVVDTLYRPGEMVAAGQPIVQLLPPANIKIRFFVPEDRVARLAVGEHVRIACDGCGAPIEAAIRFIAPQAEFTPPVIYSREQRARLVFMVEARPSATDAAQLRLGQPVDVTLATARQ